MENGSRLDLGCAAYGPRLAALVDGELPLGEQRELEAHVRRCRDCAADVARQRAVRDALRQAGASLAASPMLRGRVQASLARPDPARPRWRRVLLVGSVAAVLVLLAAIGWLQVATRAPDAALLARTVTAHQQETLGDQPVSFVSADSAAVAAWARTNTGADLELPPFGAAGYRLLGARLDPVVASRAVTVVYEGAAGRLTCTVIPTAGSGIVQRVLPGPGAAAHTGRLQGSSVISWGDRDTTYVLVADVDPSTLLQLARLASKAD